MALKDITLGQFFPGNSFLHRLDPRCKIIMVTCYIIALFSAKNFVAYALMFLILCQGIALSKVPLSAIIKGMKPLVFIASFTAILNIFYTTGETILWEYWVLTITLEGVINAFFMVSRILMLVTGTFLLTYTTSPMVLTDGLENLMNPLKKLKVPVHDLSMMMSIALRFIPNLIEETDKIMSAQRARGADFETGGFAKRAKALLPILVPLFISALRRADELAEAMDARCYHGGEGRTKMKVLHYQKIDFLVMIFMVLWIFLIVSVSQYFSF
ncbi:MAG: energy-coupling factor transporter transmembrane component T [Eubacteriales bacterium]